MPYILNKITGQGLLSGDTSVRVYDVTGKLKTIGGGTPPPPAPVVWGSITGLVTNQTDLISYLGLNFYPLSSNPAGYITQTAADLLYYPLSSNPAGYITSAALTGYVPTTRTLTINGTSYDLSADRSWTIAAGGTVTDVTGTGTVSGLTLTGTGTTSVTLTLGGTLTLTSSDITTALGYTPYNATNPAGYITLTSLSAGTGITYNNLTGVITNSAPDQVVSLASGTGISVTGTYPSFTITNTSPSLGGTVTSVQLSAGTGISLSGTNPITTSGTITVTNSAPDQTVVLTGGTGISTSGTYPNFTITNTSPDQTVSLSTTGTGLSVTGTYPSFTLQNTLPDQTVVLSAGTGISVSGTYPSFTITNTATGGGGIPFATASGTDTYTATVTGVTAYTDGDAYIIRFTNGNTDASTLNISGVGAKTLYRNNDGPLIGGDIWDGGEMICIYNSVNDGFDCIGTSPNTLFAYITNAEATTITKGQAVYAFGGTGNRMTVKLAQANGDSTSAQTIGFVFSTSIAANQKGIIIIQGYFTGLSLFPTATWADGDPVYLSPTTPGAVTNTKPYAPSHLVYLGFVATASNGAAGRMYVRVQNGYELDELHNVQAQSPTYKDTLWYDNTVSPAQWKTASIGTILGYTPVPSTRTLTIDGVGYDLSADRSWTTGGNYAAYTMRANNTAGTAAPSDFTFKDLGEQTLPVGSAPSWGGTAAPTGGTLRYRWFQTGNVVHFHFIFTYTGAGTGNTTLNFVHPTDMPIPTIFSGITASVTFLYRYLSYIATSTNTNPPTGWYGGLKRTATTPSTTYGWQFSGASIGAASWSVSGTYYT